MVNVDLREKGLSMKEMHNRAVLRQTGQKHRLRLEVGKYAVEEVVSKE